ncbi:tyrosine-type recombinase/integrase [Halogeometricum borinquense]|uniref:Site-specific Recombinase XerD n=1 Tax=Halogeometricum borinquense (strain ATCC 700274 / DSM 11551 / JCM 10706 / KCTC 4070 / PR3) TaxID=469382 RepID=E4NN72_HALBP|nr:tyrosine-type recombinase/integrase [Halogeometricum borinquense]ADQ66302.1 site-specific recombinase XerD [Halogeometricum borinquense DSM 11551]ELY27709.1 site-specific recombinase xerd [Halogeometricum borinquense DSM 11551]QIQ75675.1 tyrosine-type recombinase/integrase [Halogeometricum borinquense]
MGDDWYKTRFENKHDSINEFLTSKTTTGRSHRTINEYSRTLQRFFHEHFPELDPEDVEVHHVEQYLRILVERDLAQNTKRRYLESLSSFYAWAMKRPRYEDITGNPAAVVLEEVPKQIHDRPDCATWENAEKIVHAIDDPRDKTVAVVLAKTGCRVTEALTITREDLLLEDGFIRLTNRKGGKTTVIPVDDETVRMIQRLQFIDQNTSEYLFASSRTGNQLTRERIRRKVREAAVKTGVMEEGETRFHKKFTPHTFRTVFTTLMRNQGMPDHILQYIRGDSESETIDIYTRIDRNQAQQEYLQAIKPLHL